MGRMTQVQILVMEYMANRLYVTCTQVGRHVLKKEKNQSAHGYRVLMQLVDRGLVTYTSGGEYRLSKEGKKLATRMEAS